MVLPPPCFNVGIMWVGDFQFYFPKHQCLIFSDQSIFFQMFACEKNANEYCFEHTYRLNFLISLLLKAIAC